jgi:hypothetical protein
VKIIFVCHNKEIVYSILNDPNKNNANIIFVGKNEVDDYISNNKRVIIARNLPNNIEEEKSLLTFTAWYAIIKNNLFTNYNYLCILEYDVILDNIFYKNLEEKCKLNEYDVISFIPINYGFNWDIKEYILKYFLLQKNITLKIPDTWYATSNQCVKRNLVAAFVDWFYPACDIIKKFDPIKVSWYHERVFSFYIKHFHFNITIINGLSHQFSNSHQEIHYNLYDLSSQLVELSMDNPKCEFLSKMVENYTTFVSLLEFNFEKNIGSYLTDGNTNVYDSTKYNKQKLLFDAAKNAKEALIIGDYRGHISFIMLLANPELKITCIEKNDYVIPSYIKNGNYNINFINENNEENRVNLLYSFKNEFNYDLIHISQIYPERKFIYNYMDWIAEKGKKKIVHLIIDDVDVYPVNFKDVFLNNNINCKILKERRSNCIYPNISLEIKISNKYILLFDDETGKYVDDIKKLEDSIQKYSDFEIIKFYKKDICPYFCKSNESILNQPRGNGYWLWKPYIINEILGKLDEYDILFYIDSKYYFLEPFRDLFYNKMKKDILVWKNKPNESVYPLKQWCKMNVIQQFNMNHAAFVENYEICWAGSIVIRKTDITCSLIKKWLNICCNESFITDLSSEILNSHEFIDHRHDQSLLSVILYMFNIETHYFERRFLQNTRIPF